MVLKKSECILKESSGFLRMLTVLKDSQLFCRILKDSEGFGRILKVLKGSQGFWKILTGILILRDAEGL